MDDWQALVLQEALGERADGRWSAFEVGLVVPRQNGKGSILEARELAGLFLFGEQLILHSAHEFKTASEAFRRILSLVQNTPDLERHVTKVRTSHGDEGIELRSGARLRFVARSTGSGRGFSGDCIILDEAYALSAEAMAALLPTMAAKSVQGNPQLWYTSSAPLRDDARSDMLRMIRRRGHEGERRLCYLEWSAPEDAEADDRAAWAQANPGLGVRITEEFIESERAAMPEANWMTERLGISPDIDAGASVIPLEVWDANVDDSEWEPVGVPTFAVDVTADRSQSTIGLACWRPDERPQVEVAATGPDTGWVVPWLLERRKKYGRKMRVMFNAGGPAGSLGPDMAAAKVEFVPVTAREMAQACGLFYDETMSGVLRHLDDRRLAVSVSSTSSRSMSDAWVWDLRKPGPVSPVLAVTLARFGLPRFKQTKSRVVSLADALAEIDTEEQP